MPNPFKPTAGAAPPVLVGRQSILDGGVSQASRWQARSHRAPCSRRSCTQAGLWCPTRDITVRPPEEWFRLRCPPGWSHKDESKYGRCHNGTMRRMNLRDVPDEVYAALAEAAAANRQSLSAFVVDRLAEAAEVTRMNDYVATYGHPQGSGVTIEESVAAVRQVRETS